MRSSLVLASVLLAVIVAGCIAVPSSPAGPTDDSGETAPNDPETTAVDGEATDGQTATETAPAAPAADDETGPLAVHFIDVGQGDAALVVTPSGETMLIDSGDWRDDGETVLAYLEHRGIDRIDHLVTTHGHADHIGGHEAVIDHYEREAEGIGAIYNPGVPATTATYGRYLDAVERHDVPFFRVVDGDSVDIGERVSVEFLHPPEDRDSDDIDDNSLALTITHGENTFLFTGDAGERAEERLVAAHGNDLAADVYQAGHHGSSTSSSAPFLDAVDPAVAVISSDYESQYGHPHEEVLRRLSLRDVATYWTGTHGTIVIASDGRTLTIGTQTPATTDAAALRSEPASAAAATDPVEERSTIRPLVPAFFGASARGGA